MVLVLLPVSGLGLPKVGRQSPLGSCAAKAKNVTNHVDEYTLLTQ